MTIKKKTIKWIIMLFMIMLLLCMGKAVKAETDRIPVTHGRGDEPIDCPEQGNNGINFFCKNEWTPWNFYTKNSEVLAILDPNKFWYEQDGNAITLEPTISFGLYTAKKLGYIDLETIQHLIWGSVKYSSSTCEGGNASYYSNAINTILKRADQYGMFYYGVIGGGSQDLACTVTGGDTAKVYVNQKDRKVIVGPYQINLVCKNVTKIDEETIKTNLWQELSGLNAKLYPGAPSFAECHIQVDGATNTKFLDKDGVEVLFPNFNEDFYIECKVENDVTSIHPKVNIKYIKSARASAYNYKSDDPATEIPGYAVLDEWYDDGGVTKLCQFSWKTDEWKYAIEFIKNNMSVRRNGVCKAC